MITTDKNYPAKLPCALLEGYKIKHVSPFTRSQMKSGRSRSRRTFTSVPSVISVSWIFKNDVQAAYFEAWFRDVIDDGAAWFNMLVKSPIGLKACVCQFAEMYEGPQPVGAGSWQVTAVIETFERQLLPVGWGRFPDQVLGSSIIDIAANREWPEA